MEAGQCGRLNHSATDTGSIPVIITWTCILLFSFRLRGGTASFQNEVTSTSGGLMIDYNRKLIKKFKWRDNRLCLFRNRLSRKKLKIYWGQIKVLKSVKCTFNILVWVVFFSQTQLLSHNSRYNLRLIVFTCAYPAHCVVVTSNTPHLFERCGMLSCFVFRKQQNQNINYKLTVLHL